MTEYSSQPVAVVGLSAIMPDAPTGPDFWSNIREGRYGITDVPPDRWDADLFYDPDPNAPDKTYSRIGGWVRDFVWDPRAWRLPLPPTVAAQMDTGQQWSVSAARAAIVDAGWPDWDVDPERVAVILGNALGGEKQYQTTMRIHLREFARDLGNAPSFAALPAEVRAAIVEEWHEQSIGHLPEIQEDTMPGELSNIMAGRVASLFNFRGPNFVTDAACASALAAMSSAVQGLSAGHYDAVISGGVDRNMGVNAFVKFCKIGALSATGTRPFDAGADGFVMGEGTALFVLKRLADAERAGDRIYAVLLGLGGSSDGKGKGITAPNPVGQRLALERAWDNAGLDPSTMGLVEAHGTSTRVGDGVELGCLTEVLLKAGAAPGTVALGSVKSNIGHLKAAAGAAGFFKAVMALHEKVLPPSLHFTDPNPNLDWDESPLQVNTELREWPQSPAGVRRAGVSAFGFGGTNFHAVLEEYVPGRYREEAAPRTYAAAQVPRSSVVTAPTSAGAAAAAGSSRPPLRGALVVGGVDDSDVIAQLERVAADAANGWTPPLAAPDPGLAGAALRVAIDHADAEDLATKAGKALDAFRSGAPARWKMLRAQGVFVGRGPAPKVAFLYTGQGSQYVNMLTGLRTLEPIVAETFDEADRIMTPLLGRPLSSYIFIDADDSAAVAALEQQLLQTEITQPAVLATDLAMTRVLNAYGVNPDMVMGHSLGEYGALVAAGALTFDSALEAVSARGHEMASLSMEDNGAMAAVFGPLVEIERIVDSIDGNVVIANINSFSQAVIGGATAAVMSAIAAFEAAGISAARIPVSHAFHTSIVAPASEPLKVALRRLEVRAPVLPIVANVTGDFYPAGADTEVMLDILGRQVASPVQFVRGLNTLYEAGARVFVEVGPKKALHGFVEDVLGATHDDVLALFTNHPKNGDVPSLNAALCGLWASGLGYTPTPAVSVPAAPPVSQLPTVATRVTDAVPASPAATQRTTMTATASTPMSTDAYAELGRLVSNVIEQGLRAYGDTARATADPGRRAVPSPAVPEPVVITGAALGLPGVEQVFDDENLQRILDGQQFIDTIPHRFRQQMVDMNITRLIKRESGDPTFESIDDEADVVKLAGRHAPLDVVAQYGIDPARDAALDSVTRLAIGAGFDALRDAGIPLVMRYKATTVGSSLPERWGLPDVLRDDTGVIFASAFPGYDSFAADLEKYYTDRGHREQLLALEAVRSRMQGDEPAVPEINRRIAELRHLIDTTGFAFDRRFLFRCLSMGHSQFAEIIGARGPNTQVNAACASTTQAMAVAEDWIRAGRCRRVVVVSADDVTTDTLLPWVASGFLASGAAATDDVVEEAATPFDRRRHGMIIGMGAAAIVLESAEAARERGLQPICELLGSVIANSAFHGTRLDVDHIAQVMEQVVGQAESRGVDRNAIAASTVFVSHETYTPARGGSAAAEINALRTVFGAQADSVVITNTKGFTGHAMGAGIEDIVAIKALETGVVPPVPNFKEPDPELGDLNLSQGGSYPVDYALRLAAGFGSQIAMTLLRRTPAPDSPRRVPSELGHAYRIVDPQAWQRWLDAISGHPAARLEIATRRLRIVDEGPPVIAPAAGADSITAVPVVSPPEVAPAAPAGAAPAVAAPTVAAPAVAAPAGAEPVAVADEVVDAVVEIVAEMTGYPPELLDLDLDLEADLGVDTVKQAEVFAAVRARFGVERDDNLALRDFPTLAHVIGWIRDKTGIAAPGGTTAGVAVPETLAPAAPAAPAGAEPVAVADEVVDAVVEIVAEMTGYPPELLDLDLDLEADLGVDTVKQAEVFAAVRARFGVERDDNLALRDFPTLAHVIGWIRDKTGIAAPGGTTAGAAVPETLAPAAPAAPAGAAPAGAEPVAVADEVVDAVVEIVAEMTGYPPELLDLDLDLEADLGVDTVKQAEVFAAVRARFGVERDDNLALRDFPTLAHVIGWIRDKTGIAAPGGTTAGAAVPETLAPAAPAAPGTVTGDFDSVDRLPRRVPVPALRPALAMCLPTGVTLGEGARVVVMRDEGGVADALIEQLAKSSVAVLALDPATTPDALLSAIDTWRADGPVTGVFWLPALDDEGPHDELDLFGWQEALRRRVKSLYVTMRRLYDDSPFLVTGTRLGGQHGYDDAGATAPMGGAVTGFAKSYKKERPEALVKAVDLTVDEQTAQPAQLLIDETLRDPGCVEVGHVGGLRWGVGLVERPFPPQGQPAEGALTLGSDSVVLVTGAAGSIVSAITADLAKASGATFHLLDLTPAPDAADPDLRRFLEDRDGLKTDLAQRMRDRGDRPTPVAIDKELARFERLAAGLAAVEAVEAAGGTAHYHCVDLNDADAVARVLDKVRSTSERIDLFLHAAGLEISKALPDKTPEEFDLVFGVKSDGWFNVIRGAGDLPIGATVVFSSVAGRFGNAGQVDYSAANDLLCKITSNARRTRPGTRGLALDWTAWGGIGMATRGSIPKIMEMAGVEMLPPEAGVAWIRRELTAHAFMGEVVVAGELGQMAGDGPASGGLDLEAVDTARAGPMVGEVARADELHGLVVQTTLDPLAQPFLDHHRIDGTAVLPGVMGMEAFAEVARLLAPGWHVVDVGDVDFRAPVKFYRDEPRTLTVTALVRPDGADLVADCSLAADRTLPGSDKPQRRIYFTGSVRLSTQARDAETATVVSRADDTPSVAHDDVYRLYFHGPAYQVVAEAWQGDEAAVARFATDLPPNHEPADLPTVLEPRLVELCFQAAGLWEAGRNGRLALPAHVGGVLLVGAAPVDMNSTFVAVARPVTGGAAEPAGFDCAVFDDEGRVILRVEDYRTVALPGELPDEIRGPLEIAMADAGEGL